MKRRTWILSALGATGALTVGWGLLPARSRLGKPSLMLPTEGDVALNGWIKINRDGTVTLAMPKSEMGQGIYTALSMMVAEELDVPLSATRLEQAGPSAIFGNVAMFVNNSPFHPLESEGAQKPLEVRAGEWMLGKIARELGLSITGGSSSVADAWEPLRQAAAIARASLLASAATQWGVPVAELSVKAGVVSHPSGKSGHYGEFAKGAAGLTPQDFAVKDRKDWTLIGQPALRVDIPAKTNGTARYGIDVRQPGMLFASVRMAPMLGGTIQSMDSKAALAMPGVERLVKLDSWGGSTAGFAVVGLSTWHTKQAALAVDVQWAQRAQGALDTQRIQADMQEQLKAHAGETFYSKGSADKAEAAATRLVTANYSAPYLAHATMEPMNCTAQVKDGKVEVWAPTQVPSTSRTMAAQVAGVSEDDVTLHVTLLGGGFGRRLDVDYVGQAVQVAMACEGKPVQLIWSREEDMAHDFYRPMHVVQMQAAVDAHGAVTSLRIKSAGDSIATRWILRSFPPVAKVVAGSSLVAQEGAHPVFAVLNTLAPALAAADKTAPEGLFDLPYGFANQHMAHVYTHMGVPVGFFRSVGHSHNAFFAEGFIDELAFETQHDPFVFRAALLGAAPRHLAVLKLAAEKAQWGKAMPAGRAQGIALHESFGSIVAEVVEVSVENGVPRVHKVVVAIDCGTVINPNTVAQQMESGVIFGLTAALYGKIDIKDGVVQQTNFPNYPMVKLAEAPVVETYIVPSTGSPRGVGEPGVPPLAPAVANALFVLTGKRHRALPLV